MTRFERSDQVVAYAGLDIEVKESGKWKGQAKLSSAAVGGCDAFCIWQPCGVPAAQLPPLGRMIIVCWLVA